METNESRPDGDSTEIDGGMKLLAGCVLAVVFSAVGFYVSRLTRPTHPANDTAARVLDPEETKFRNEVRAKLSWDKANLAFANEPPMKLALFPVYSIDDVAGVWGSYVPGLGGVGSVTLRIQGGRATYDEFTDARPPGYEPIAFEVAAEGGLLVPKTESKQVPDEWHLASVWGVTCLIAKQANGEIQVLYYQPLSE